MLDQDWPGFFRRHILESLPVDKLALLFPEKMGRPTKELYTVLGALALQQYHDLTDQETSKELSYDIQWHYALDLAEESDDAKYICPKTLWSMRVFATELGLENDVFDITAKKLAELFDVDTSKQRIDSVHIRSNMARLGRVGIFVKSIDRFLVNLKRQHRSLWDRIDPEIIQRYQGEKARQCFAAVKPSESKRVLSDVASDLYRLVIQFEGKLQVADMHSYKLLCRIVKEQCDVHPDGTVTVKKPKQIPSDSLQNPSDPDATYSRHKGQGYQVQVMETYTEHEEDQKDASELNLITHVKVEKACQSDAKALVPAVEETQEKDLAPETLQADALYGSDENTRNAEQLGVEVVSPAMGAEKQSETKLSDFCFRSDGHVKTCPAGHEPVIRKKKNGRYSQGFELETCQSCPRLESCPVKKGKAHCFLRYEGKPMRIAKRRQYENSDEFKDRYRWRAGVEATMSQYDRLTGVKRLRVRGFKTVSFAAVMKAVAVNIARAVAVQRARAGAPAPESGPSGAATRVYRTVKELFCGIFVSLSRWSSIKPALRAYTHYMS
ncbi:MAG: transposase [Desulfobacterales bacterium]|nr:transposase [Desulfobacterales bacterium]